jgi:hypothetical protein
VTLEWKVCPDCGTFDRFGATTLLNHRCSPEWEWRCDACHLDDEWERVRARDAEGAAELAAERYDQEDYYLLRTNGDVQIHVRDLRTGEVTRWSCSGEAVPQYHARQIVDAPATADPPVMSEDVVRAQRSEWDRHDG